MLKHLTLATGLVLAFGAPAFADCAGDTAAVEAALPAAQVSDDDKTAIMDAVAKAKEQTGDEAACEESLKDAKMKLGLM